MTKPLRVGVYVDAFNLYYGGKKLCQNNPEWKWLDLNKLAEKLIKEKSPWRNIDIQTIVYCTAQISSGSDSFARQQNYLLAMRANDPKVRIEFGEFQTKVKESVVAIKHEGKVRLIDFEEDPLPIEPWTRLDSVDSKLLVSHRKREEKGSDVNIASNLLIDVLEGAIDAAVVVSNDSDLAKAVGYARTRIPLGVINPRGYSTSGRLIATSKTEGQMHWDCRVSAVDLLASQMGDLVGKYKRPPEWSLQ